MEHMEDRLKIKQRMIKWEKSFIRDRWGSLTDCFWNELAKEEIIKMENQLNEIQQNEKVN